MRSLLLVLLVAACCMRASGQAGTLDPTFGNNGLVRTDFIINGAASGALTNQVLAHPDGSIYLVLELGEQTIIAHYLSNGTLDMAYGENGYSVPVRIRQSTGVMQPDGKIVVAGSVFLNENFDFAVARFTANGSLDNSFSGDGVQNTNLAANGDQGVDVVLQPDGKIIVAGRAGVNFGLVRYNPDGSPDTSFDRDGKLQTSFATPVTATTVLLQPDGKIIVVGNTNIGGAGAVATARYLPDGVLDNSFSGDGRETAVISTYSQVADAALQADGKIVVGGLIVNPNNGNLDFLVARLIDGTLDNSFSGDGLQSTEFGSFEDRIESLVIQPDGKIVAGGRSQAGGPPQFAVARYNTDGSLDNSFSGDGMVITTVGPASTIFAMALQADGKILAGGVSDGYAVVRYTTAGIPDNSFDGDGIVIGKRPGGTTQYYASALQPDGKIIAAGFTSDAVFTSSHFAIARYNTDGSLDNSFSGDGKMTVDFGPAIDFCFAVAVQPDGKIVLAGYTQGLANNDVALARLNADGTPDNSFSSDGKLVMGDLGGNEIAYDMQLQPDGKIVIAGSADAGGNQNFLLARFNADGTPDNSFSGDGILMTDFGSATDFASALVIQPDGKIIAVGVVDAQSLNSHIAIARYNPNGDPDPSFDGDGLVVSDFFGARDDATSVVLQPDGKIIIAGGYTNFFDGSFNGNQLLLACYHPNGSLDNSFSGDGVLILDAGSTNEHATDIAIQADGKIVVGGFSHGGNNNDLALVRLLPDGTLDNSFAGDGIVVRDFGLGEDIIESINISGNRVYGVGRTAYVTNVGAVVAYLLGDLCTVNVSIPDAMALSEGVNANTVYIGYAPAGQITLIAQPAGGTGPYSFLWSNGATTQSIVVSPGVATMYSVTVTDAGGCSKATQKMVNVMDVRCGNKLDKVMLCHRSSGTNCVSASAVPAQLKKGAYLGNCNLITGRNGAEVNEVSQLKLSASPNPGRSAFTLDISGGSNSPAELRVYDVVGKRVEVRKVVTNSRVKLGGEYKPGVYWVQVWQGNENAMLKLVKVE